MIEGIEGFSHCLSEHPLNSQSEKIKQHYFCMLQYITDTFSNDCDRAKAMLFSYKKQILGNKIPILYSEKTIRNSYKQVIKNRIKQFNICTLRYHFLFDCLCINAYDDVEKIEKILSFLDENFKSRHNIKLKKFVACLLGSSGQDEFREMEKQISSWKQNKHYIDQKVYKIVFTANMSAGKSTIINALVGNCIAETAEEACTQNVSYIYNKSFDDGFIDIYSPEYKIRGIDDLCDGGICNDKVALHFKKCIASKKRICLIDTPGVNSAINKQHKRITQKFIADGNYNVLVYVFNAETLGTDDEYRYLKYISENVPKNKIVFAVNKLDIYRRNSDTVKDSISRIVDDLNKIGFGDPIVCPISARFAFLQKLSSANKTITEDELEELEFFEKKFSRKDYDLSLFYEPETNVNVNNNLAKSGFYNFEKLIYGGMIS